MTEEPFPPFSDLQIVDVFLEQANMKSMRDVSPIPTETPLKFNTQWQIGYRIASPNELRIRIGGEITFTEDSPKPYELSLSIIGIYQCKNPITDEDAGRYMKTHSLPLLFPYLREAVSNFTLRMTGKALMIPTLQIIVRQSGEKEETTEDSAASEA